VTDVRRADAAQRESGTQLLHTVEEERRRTSRFHRAAPDRRRTSTELSAADGERARYQ
jgi:hypothetical protein